MLRNQASALIEHERIQTTVPKAKELRSFVERIISIAKRSLDAPAGSSRAVIARRRVSADIADRKVVTKLFDTIAPRYTERPGGYTRLLRLGHRRGDAADLASIELVGSEYNPKAETEKDESKEAPKKAKGVGDRLKQAAQRMRSSKTDGAKAQAGGQTRGKAQKSTTPRKAGGS